MPDSPAFRYGFTCVTIEDPMGRRFLFDDDGDGSNDTAVPFHTEAEARDYLRQFVFRQAADDRAIDAAGYSFPVVETHPDVDGPWYVSFRKNTDSFHVFNQAFGSAYPAGTFEPFALDHFVAGPFSNYGDAFDHAGACDQLAFAVMMDEMSHDSPTEDELADTALARSFSDLDIEQHNAQMDAATTGQAARLNYGGLAGVAGLDEFPF